MTQYTFAVFWFCNQLAAAFMKGYTRAYTRADENYLYINGTLFIGFFCLIAAIRERK